MAQEAAHQRCIGFDAALAPEPIAQRLKRNVRLLGPQSLDKLSMRLQFQRLVAAHLRSRPLRSTRSTHLMAADSLTPNRSAAALRLMPSRRTASITRSRKSCENAPATPAGLRPANRLNQNATDLGIPPRF